MIDQSNPFIGLSELEVFLDELKTRMSGMTESEVRQLIDQLSINEILSSTQPASQNNGDVWLKVIE